MVSTRYLCVHGHFYQPPRGNPFVDTPLEEESAAPYQNWNERITAESYQPNAELGNFEYISFNLGETLASWLALNAPETYQRILQADQSHLKAHGVGNAIAQSMHHTILPLERRADKVTQVTWGKASFRQRYGRETEGIWLPEMAVDIETLEVLAEQGIEWTILTESQVKGKPAGAGPYWVDLPGGKRIKVFVRDEYLSNDIAFNLGNFGGAGRWAREVLAPRRHRVGALTLIASDGETFGHHWRGEEQFLHWLISYEAQAAGYTVVTLAQYARMVEPKHAIKLVEDTAWSSMHGLGRWLTGSADTSGDSYWKGALRRAMDLLRVEIDSLYREEMRRIDKDVDPIQVRDAWINVVLGLQRREDFVKYHEIDAVGEDEERVLKLVEAQYHRHKMYASCAFFFSDLTDLSVRYGIASAAYATRLIEQVTGVDLTPDFRRDLRLSRGYYDNEMVTALDIFDEVLEEFHK